MHTCSTLTFCNCKLLLTNMHMWCLVAPVPSITCIRTCTHTHSIYTHVLRQWLQCRRGRLRGRQLSPPTPGLVQTTGSAAPHHHGDSTSSSLLQTRAVWRRLCVPLDLRLWNQCQSNTHIIQTSSNIANTHTTQPFLHCSVPCLAPMPTPPQRTGSPYKWSDTPRSPHCSRPRETHRSGLFSCQSHENLPLPPGPAYHRHHQGSLSSTMEDGTKGHYTLWSC